MLDYNCETDKRVPWEIFKMHKWMKYCSYIGITDAAKMSIFPCNNLQKVKVAQLHLMLCDPMGYTVHGILQARILEWVTFPSSRESSQPRDQTQVFHIAGRFFISWTTRKAQEYWSGWPVPCLADLPHPGIWGFLHCTQIISQLSHQGSPWSAESMYKRLHRYFSVKIYILIQNAYRNVKC